MKNAVVERDIFESGTRTEMKFATACRAQSVQRARDDFFTGAGRAGHQYRREVPRDFAELIENFEHRGTFADDAVKVGIEQKLLVELPRVHLLGRLKSEFIERSEYAVEFERLAQIVARAFLDCAYGGLD